VASEAVPSVFLPGSASPRHITSDATEEIKLDGYRAIAVKSAGKLNLFSRRRNSFNRQYSLVFEALADVPDNTVVDGEVVALNEAGTRTSICFSTTGRKPHKFIISSLISSFMRIETSRTCRSSSVAKSAFSSELHLPTNPDCGLFRSVRREHARRNSWPGIGGCRCEEKGQLVRNWKTDRVVG
jgi:hypothetical protein